MTQTEVEVAKPFTFNNLDLPGLDCVLVYSKQMMEEHPKKNDERLAFETAMDEKKIQFKERPHPYNPDLVLVQVYFPYELLCQEAESIGIQMAIKLKEEGIDEGKSCMQKCEDRFLVNDFEEDYISAPFVTGKIHAFVGHEKSHGFFRDCLYDYLIYHILVNGINIRDILGEEKKRLLCRKGLAHLLMTETYRDFHLLHDPTELDPFFEHVKQKRIMAEVPPAPPKDADISLEERQFLEKERQEKTANIEQNLKFSFDPDNRKLLDKNWKATCCKYQPLFKIRNYFGEQIAFYFAWQGHLITYLWLPLILGVIVFIYGLYESVTRSAEATVAPMTTTAAPSAVDEIVHLVDNMLSTIKSAFDNLLTPFFALVICIWGTVFTETWKRFKARLAFDWDVEDFRDLEPDRAEFKPTCRRTDPYTGKEEFYYPYHRQFIKFATSLVVLVVMIVVVLIAVTGVIVYRVFVTINVCPNVTSTTCLVVNMVASSLMNAIAIVLLGLIYEKMAYKLTDWENMRTQTAYEDAVILKLFVFQFANCYTSLFYIAFFRSGGTFVDNTNGIFNLGPEYVDTCGADGDCMAMLSIQVLILMLVKPLPKFLKDIILPFALKLLRKCRCCAKVTSNAADLDPQDWKAYVAFELEKPPLTVFPLSEYMEKVIQYGFLMLFTAAFPLGPIIVILTNVIDNKVDASRLLWVYRRPVPLIAQNIGIWQYIVEFVNTCGVISNALLIAFTSKWGKQFSFSTQLIIVLGIEHCVFFLKYFLDVMIPDVPTDIALDIRRERQLINDMFFDETYGTLESCDKCNPNYRPKPPKGTLPSKPTGAQNTRNRSEPVASLYPGTPDNAFDEIEMQPRSDTHTVHYNVQPARQENV